jgi:hypothetical protein
MLLRKPFLVPLRHPANYALSVKVVGRGKVGRVTQRDKEGFS